MAAVYKITNLINGKFYIGKTVGKSKYRFNAHKRNAAHGNTHLYKSMRKHGIDNFIIEEIEICSNEQLNNREIFHISTMKPQYNETKGGDGGDTSHTEGYKRGLANRKSVKGFNNPMYGTEGGMKDKSHTVETKEKQSIARTKFWTNDENKKNLSTKISGENNGMFGKLPKNARIIKYDGFEYPSLKAAVKATGLNINRLKKLGAIIL